MIPARQGGYPPLNNMYHQPDENIGVFDIDGSWEYNPNMGSNLKQALFGAILKLLRPLVRILLRNGVPFRGFSELAKWVYVDVAKKEFGIEGRKQSDSRVSIITGLTRKDVRRLGETAELDNAEMLDRYNRAARVISGWVRDPEFVDRRGNPLDLAIDAGEVRFGLLVKKYSGDIPARAVLDELLNVGAVRVLEDGRVRLESRAYIPSGGEADKLAIMGTDVADLISTIDHNIEGKGEDPFFQRKVSYDNVPAEAVEEFRKMSAGYAQEYLELLDRWLSKHDRDTNSKAKGTGRKRLGLGIYYFEEHLDDDDAA